jgi:NMT1 family protein
MPVTDKSDERKIGPLRIQRVSWRDLATSLGLVLLVSAAAFWIALHFVRPAPPGTITMASGPEGSSLWNYAERYRKILARDRVKLKVLPTEGTLDNLKRLSDPKSGVDIGFVQGGLSSLADTGDLVSLGSMFYEPLVVFYRGAPIERLAGLKGSRIAIGPEGSGTRILALNLLKANGIEPKGTTTLLDLEGKEAEQALLKGTVDAAFIMGDSATPTSIRALLQAPGIRTFDFVQADAYVRRFRYLSKLELPPGSFDLGRNLPSRPLTLIAPTVELIARRDLHPALSDLLIAAAHELHRRATLIQRAGEFPAPLEHEYPIGGDAARYYKSGKGVAYRFLPFWAASLVDRALVVLLPIILVLIPGLRLAPTLYGWRAKSRIYRRYGELMALERAAMAHPTSEQRTELLKRLTDIEKSVISLKIPGSLADQVYVLREHIDFVREQLAKGAHASANPA